MPERKEGFLGRWSRLKRADRDLRQEVEPAAAAPVPPDAMPAPADAEAPLGAAPAVPDLPPLDSLGRESDFTAFMQPGVPGDLRNSALRKLWRSDPVLANLDGLVEYGEDFAAPFRSTGLVATVYQVGKGMVDSLAGDSAETAAAPADSGASAGGDAAIEVRSGQAADPGDSADAKAAPEARPGPAPEPGDETA